MYRCYNPKRLFRLLLLDAILLCLWFMFSAIGKTVFFGETVQEGVFLPIIMYHSITVPAMGDYQITPDMLETDLRYLQENGYETISIETLCDYTNGLADLPEKPIMLTFDDGFYNTLSTALPLLEQYDMCAVVAVVGYYTDVTAVQDPHSDSYSYLTWEDIHTLLESGRVEIANHTYNMHSNTERAGCSILYGESEEAYADLLTSDLHLLQFRMQEKTGTTPAAFTYPYGFVCRESVPVLKELGFVCSFTCCEQPNYIVQDSTCLYGLNRYNRSSSVTTEAFFERVLEPQDNRF